MALERRAMWRVVESNRDQAQREHVGRVVEIVVQYKVRRGVIEVELDGSWQSGVNVENLREIDLLKRSRSRRVDGRATKSQPAEFPIRLCERQMLVSAVVDLGIMKRS